MKKFHDIKVRQRAKRSMPDLKRKKPDRNKHSDLFWSKDDEKRFDRLRKPKKDYSRLKKAVYKGAAVAMLLAAFLGFSYARAINDVDEFEQDARSMKISLNSAILGIESGNLSQAISEQEVAYQKLQSMKLNLEGWGQNSYYLSLMGDKRSKFVNLEKLLRGSSKMFEASIVLEEGLGNSLNQGGEDVIVDFEKLTSDLNNSFEKSIGKLDEAERTLDDINTKVLSEYKIDIERAKTTSKNLRISLTKTKEIFDNEFKWLCGLDNEDKNILIIFQNNAELRGGSGGSLGSFGTARLSNGDLKTIDFGQNIFKYDNPFKGKDPITPPKDLVWVVPDGRWTLKDSGWAVDGLDALKNVHYFYELETGEKIDGIMTIDTSFFQDILRFTGPIEVANQEVAIDENNFRSIVEYEVHKGYFERDGNKEENEPKEILSQMMPKVIEKIFSQIGEKTKAVEFFQILKENAQRKNILLYMNNLDFQRKLTEYNLTGQVQRSDVGDYLYINNSNLDGFKSSLSIGEDIRLHSTIGDDFLVNNELRVRRNHFGKDEWPDGTNRNMVRLLLPYNFAINSFEIIEGNFFEHADNKYKNNQPFWNIEEVDQSGIGYWMNAAPKETAELLVKYSFSSNVDTDGDKIVYPVVFQKQPGSLSSSIEYTLSYPENLRPLNVKEFDQDIREIKFKFMLDKDIYYNILFEKIKN